MTTSAIVRPDQIGSVIPLFSPAAASSASEGEVPFGFDEIFCSRTDGRGVIQAGNAVFRRVSGYEVFRLVGAPHKIVRNPIMPKAAFYLLWERLRAGKPTGVYVCNRSQDGRSYWVFAVNFPIRDGFMSVRFKPGSAHFDRVRDMYKDLHAAEVTFGRQLRRGCTLHELRIDRQQGIRPEMTVVLVGVDGRLEV